jgi:hypothetical protein
MTLERKPSMTETSRVAADYAYERDLVEAFVGLLTAGGVFAVEEFGLEFDYRRGRADVVALSDEGHVIAFEAKLSDWREALHQAYRNTCFAGESYVVMPIGAALRAVGHAIEFDRRGVGLCAISNGAIEILHAAPRRKDVLEPHLKQRAADFAASSAGQ